MANPVEDISPFTVLINEVDVDDAIQKDWFKKEDKQKINFHYPYTVTKRHFVGNVAIYYDYYIPKLELWIYDFCIEPKKVMNKKEFVLKNLKGVV